MPAAGHQDLSRSGREAEPLLFARGARGIEHIAPGQEAGRKPQFAHALGVTAGRHAVEVCEWTNPGIPPEPPRRKFQ